ncbi:hypothetical protein EKK97_13855 [Billgrantia tianxiuensis]|uniref:Uncharacterized protein n=1 Tax=Billgrantia tianxiuensis TaxID=2497861 RepID=A0A6I6SIU7_9GAMM|nr:MULTISPECIES: hypothetical protein [Halomonas]MCE8034582.1 hypothetical protein [Halomonas sp. MCCC 1A11057]QHC50449.1 hypothetical protein EKK97_13855 [Halomonas tianxiuensis]
MTNEQIALLAGITALTLACRDQTGIRIYHEVQAWPDGHTWSQVRALGGNCDPIFGTLIDIQADGSEVRVSGAAEITTLAQQRDALASWIAEHRKEKAA